MSARLASGAESRDRQPVCSAPSCWDRGESIEIDGRGDDAPVLCEFHAKSYLGVST